jgi:hypothetical protein
MPRLIGKGAIIADAANSIGLAKSVSGHERRKLSAFS